MERVLKIVEKNKPQTQKRYSVTHKTKNKYQEYMKKCSDLIKTPQNQETCTDLWKHVSEVIKIDKHKKYIQLY